MYLKEIISLIINKFIINNLMKAFESFTISYITYAQINETVHKHKHKISFVENLVDSQAHAMY